MLRFVVTKRIKNTKKTEIMATFKLHIYKKRADGKLNPNNSECGRGWYTSNGAPNVMYKTNEFKRAFEQGEGVCLTCLNRAKEQGRI